MPYLNIPGYTVVQEIYTSSKIALYRGHSSQNTNDSVIIKVSKQPDDRSLIARFEHEYMIVKSLRDLEHIIQVRDFISFSGYYSIIFEDNFAISLDVIIHRKGMLSAVVVFYLYSYPQKEFLIKHLCCKCVCKPVTHCMKFTNIGSFTRYAYCIPFIPQHKDNK
jgi:serine/threonine protein kinase